MINKTETLRVCDGVTWHDVCLLYRLKIPGGYCAVYQAPKRGEPISTFEPDGKQTECGLMDKGGDKKC